MLLTKQKHYRKDNRYGYETGRSPFIDYILEDKESYKPLSSSICRFTGKPWIDRDNDFLIGESGGVLMKIDFVFVGTEIFSRVADFYEKHGCYCLEPDDSPNAIKFWQREMDRRVKGVQAYCKLYIKDIPAYLAAKSDAERKALLHKVRITGDHYNYLNYGRIERAPNEKERKQLDKEGKFKVNTVEGFPRFWDGDYWNFKIDELIANNSCNLCKAKARRKGFSYKRGSQAANTINANKNVTVTLAADQMDYLTEKGATSYMVKVNLDWYEDKTYWRRGYLSENFDKGIELGYKKSKEGQKAFGFRSKLLSVAIGKNESAAVGKKAIETDFEEAGKCPNLQKALDVMMSNSESGAMRIGTIRVYGTGGTKGANWEAFSNCFYNPGKNDMLPMENIWDANSRHAVCGFFFPQIWDYEPFIEDGNSLLFASWKDDYDKKRGAEKEKDAGEYNIYVGQRANSPNEAFTNTQENIFHSPELTNHINAIKYDKSNHFYEDGWYILDDGRVRFVTKQECIERAIFGSDRFHEYITDVPHNSKTDVHGCIREFYSPIPNDGSLYFISYDPYRVDKNKEEVSTKNSLASFQVWMRTNSKTPYMGKRLVASYCGRLDTMEAVDKLVLYACLRWNCKVLYEAGTGELVTNFKKWGYRDKLLKDPSSYINRSVDGPRITGYGIVIGDGDIKLEGMRMVRDFLYEIVGKTSDDTPIYRFNQIYDISFLLELDRFIFGRNADRLSSAIVAMFEFRKDSLLLEREANSKSKTNNTGRKVNRFLK
nr:MAG: Terminase [Bacteriophage sp.]